MKTETLKAYLLAVYSYHCDNRGILLMLIANFSL